MINSVMTIIPPAKEVFNAGSHFASGRIFSAEQPYTRSSGKGVCRRFDIDYYCFDIEYPGTDYYEPFLQE